MKKLTLVIAMLGLFLTGFAGNADLFSYDADKVEAELTELTVLENFVSENGMTYSDLLNTNSSLVENVSNSTFALGATVLEPVMGIPSFIWGFCFNVAGVAIVYFVSEDMDETKKALYGCIVSGVLYVAWYVFWYASWFF